MTYNHDKFLTLAMSQDATGRYASVRSLIAAGAAYAMAETATDARHTLDTFGAALKAAGETNGGVSTKRKQVKIVGEAFHAVFAAQLASEYEDESAFVEACFAMAFASGVKSVLRLTDWIQHGNANYSDKKKQDEADDKARDRESKARDRLANVEQAEIGQIAIGAPVAPAPVRQPERPSSVVSPRADLATIVAELLAEHGASALREEIARQVADAKVAAA